jgi:neutral ceramidase
MRKWIAIVAGILVVAGDNAVAQSLRAGAAKVDITPGPDVPLSGPVGGSGKAANVHDPLFARALAIQDGDVRVVLCVCDVTMIASDLHDRIRARVQQQTGLPKTHLLVSTTHTHRAPRVVELELGEAHDRYRAGLIDKVAAATAAALGRLEPARVGWASIDQPGPCRNRRWLMKPGSLGPK